MMVYLSTLSEAKAEFNINGSDSVSRRGSMASTYRDDESRGSIFCCFRNRKESTEGDYRDSLVDKRISSE